MVGIRFGELHLHRNRFHQWIQSVFPYRVVDVPHGVPVTKFCSWPLEKGSASRIELRHILLKGTYGTVLITLLLIHSRITTSLPLLQALMILLQLMVCQSYISVTILISANRKTVFAKVPQALTTTARTVQRQFKINPWRRATGVLLLSVSVVYSRSTSAAVKEALCWLLSIPPTR